MSFIGNSFTNQTFVPQVDYFNGNASNTAFTLSRNVASVADVQVVIENVPQNPSSAFTVSGNVITFTSAPPSGTNNIYVRYTSPTTNLVKPAPGTVSPTEINSSYSLWNLSGSTINYTAGNVGIGTTSPASKLDVFADTVTFGDTGSFNFAINGTNILFKNGAGGTTERMRITSGGDIQTKGGTVYFGATNTGDIFVSPSTGFMYYEYPTSYGAIFRSQAGTEAMRIRSDGNIGISTIGSSNYKLMVNSTTPNQEVVCIQTLNTNTGTGLAGEGPLMLQNTNNTNNNMAAISNFDANGYINSQLNFINTDHAGGGAMAFTTRTNGGASYGERMRITQNGTVLVGASSLGGIEARLSVQSDSSSSYYPFCINNTAAGTTSYVIQDFYRNSSRTGTITQTGGTSYNTTSDYRLKEDIQPITGALDRVALLKPVTFKWKEDDSVGEGFIAHELQEVCPLAVHGEKDALDKNGNIDPQGVDTSHLVGLLTAAIQEQQAIIEDLKSRIEVLEAK